jgi:hypothetical protein
MYEMYACISLFIYILMQDGLGRRFAVNRTIKHEMIDTECRVKVELTHPSHFTFLA